MFDEQQYNQFSEFVSNISDAHVRNRIGKVAEDLFDKDETKYADARQEIIDAIAECGINIPYETQNELSDYLDEIEEMRYQ